MNNSIRCSLSRPSAGLPPAGLWSCNHRLRSVRPVERSVRVKVRLSTIAALSVLVCDPFPGTRANASALTVSRDCGPPGIHIRRHQRANSDHLRAFNCTKQAIDLRHLQVIALFPAVSISSWYSCALSSSRLISTDPSAAFLLLGLLGAGPLRAPRPPR